MNKQLVALALSSLLSVAVLSAPVTWQIVGQGEMRWTFFKVYNIELYSDDGSYKAEAFPQALDIQYHRDISAKQLVEATRDQWQHIGFTHPDTELWLEQLQTVWPDINKRESLRFEVYADMRNQFFYQNNAIGSIENTAFSSAFLQIWLSPKTSEPKLRSQLIGDNSIEKKSKAKS